MHPKYFYDHELIWYEGNKLCYEDLGRCSSDDMMEKLKKKRKDGYLNAKVNCRLEMEIDDLGYITEFEDIKPDNNVYINTIEDMQIYITKKGIEVAFICYIYNFRKKCIETYKGKYIYSQDMLYLDKINTKTRKEEKSIIVTSPKKEKLIEKIGGNYNKLAIFLKNELINWYNEKNN